MGWPLRHTLPNIRGLSRLPRLRPCHDAVSAHLRFDRLLLHKPRPECSLVLAMVICRLLEPGANLKVERELGPAGQTTLTALLSIREIKFDALCDAPSSHGEGSRSELAARGYSSDHRIDRPQVIYGLLCNTEG